MSAPKFFACTNTMCKVCIIYSNHLLCLSTFVQCSFRTVSKTMSVRLIQIYIKEKSSEKTKQKKTTKKPQINKQNLKWLALVFWLPAVSKTARDNTIKAEVCFWATINCTKCKCYLTDQCNRKVVSQSSTEICFLFFFFLRHLYV